MFKKSFLLIICSVFALQLPILAGSKANIQHTKQDNNPIIGLLERIDAGASDKFLIDLVSDETEYFELDQENDKVVVRGTNYVAIATGINWYLKYYLNIHLSWNGMKANLPAVLPAVESPERHDANVQYRYEFNFCTFSYGTAFWDWDRWEQEIDWMALHGVNLPLMLTGTETVWRDLLLELGYSKTEINEFIAGPAFQAWWQMNNLEGWGGPNPDSWYENQVILGNKVIDRYREFGMEPVMPGYAGMVPSNANQKLGLSVSDPGTWCTFQRPAFLLPTDSRFEEIADKYYAKMTNLFGSDLKYFTADPFHEGGNVGSVDLAGAGTAIFNAMTRANEDAKWVIQSWHENPRQALIDPMDVGEVIVLDLFSDGSPKWQSPGYGKHHWIYTMLHNFGGRSGMYGRLSYIADTYYNAQNNATADMKDGHAGVPGYRYFKWTHKYIYADWNNNKVFEEDELIYAIQNDGNDNDAANISTLIEVPADAHIGDIRLRVRYTNGYWENFEIAKDPCRDVIQGGIYDFTIQTSDTGTSNNKSLLSEKLYCFPNPTNNILQFSEEVTKAILIDVNGKQLIETDKNRMTLSHLPNSIYIVQLVGNENESIH